MNDKGQDEDAFSVNEKELMEYYRYGGGYGRFIYAALCFKNELISKLVPIVLKGRVN